MHDRAHERFPRVGDERRYHAIGGVAAWRVPVLFGMLSLSVSVAGEWGVAGLLGLVGLILHGIERSGLLEVSAFGLSQGHGPSGRLLGSARVLPWRGITRIETRWRTPHDFTSLHTVVSGPHVGSITFSSRMGLGAYRALIEDVSRRAPWANQTGLTSQFLAEACPESPRRLTSRDRGLILAAALLLTWVVWRLIA